MEKITVPKGDKGYDLSFTVTDSSASAYDLSGYLVTLKVWAAKVSGTLLIDSNCPVDTAASGTCHYTVANGDFDTVGRYIAELELTKSGVIESTENFSITVVESG